MAYKKLKSDYDTTTLKRGEKYEHYVPAVPILENFEEIYQLKYRLVRSYEELLEIYNNEYKPDGFFAWDTETTSLNPEQGSKTGDLVEGIIVGYSFTWDGHTGFYVPVKHSDIEIGYKALKILYAMICKSKLHLLYNARFDMRFLEAMTPEKYDYIPEPDEKIYKFDLSKTKYFDVQCSVWLADTNVPMPSLKKSEKHFLGWNPPTFSDTIGDEANFGYLPAEQGYRYACIDALGTYHLFFKTERFIAESGAAGKLDNECLYPLMRLENTPIYVDHEYLRSMKNEIQAHLKSLKEQLYAEAGMEYNISSGRELVGVFQQMGIDTGARTATGQMKTDIKTIENYCITHGDNEYLKKLVENKSIKNSIINSIKKNLEEKSFESNEHTKRVLKYAEGIGKRLKLKMSEMDELIITAKLHDIGKIGIDEHILKKTSDLTKEEYEIVKTHSEKGYRIINASSDLDNVAKCVLSHHERWDGKGYPLGLKGEEIPLISRIISVVDAYDVMTNDRPYRKALKHESAMEELERCSGTQFDPAIVKEFKIFMKNEKN